MSSRLPSRLLLLWHIAKQYVCSRGKRNQPLLPQRILIAHHLLLGDTLMLTSLLAKLRQNYPRASIVMTVRKTMTTLYQHRPFDVDVVEYDPRDHHSLQRLLKLGPFDWALIPGDNRYSWLAYAMGARFITAFSGDRPAYKNWPIDEFIDYSSTPKTWSDMLMDLCPGDLPKPYTIHDWQAPDYAPFTSPKQPYAVLHVGASTPLKHWQPEKWRELADALKQQGFTVAWSSGRGEEYLVSAITPTAEELVYAGKLSLAQMWHLLGHAHLLICPDTGIAHLGRITGVSTLVLFGPGSQVLLGNGEYWQHCPMTPITIDPFPCRDQQVLFKRLIPWVRRCGRSPKECSHARCMQAITREQVQKISLDNLSHPNLSCGF